MDVASIFSATYLKFPIADILVLPTAQKRRKLTSVSCTLGGCRIPFLTTPCKLAEHYFLCGVRLPHPVHHFYARFFRIRQMFLYIQCGKRCTIYPIMLGPPVSVESLFFCATGKQAVHKASSSLQAMLYRFPTLPFTILVLPFLLLMSPFKTFASASTCNNSHNCFSQMMAPHSRS